ncbi:hypothetical protein D9756_002691 [Leucocoprinus leucothites]|uniref:F-box domain-containing protein n=1 Tax=Leucocoprinus leucothites TaxID=201217 RepID=A0A8H5LM44_9AGAR|nr:hypothetical protein D9756_002691 [Leucoagaricus leucothites]
MPEQLISPQNESTHMTKYDFPNRKQNVVWQTRNAIDSSINRLPFETISTIFFYAICHPSPFNHYTSWGTRRVQLKRNPEDAFFSVTLGAVCSSWRTVVLSTPKLWTYFEYPESAWKRKRDCRYLLALYLHNSRHLPISISLTFTGDVDNSLLWHPSFDRALISNLKRIHSLSLQNPPPCWVSQLKDIPFIVNLSIDWESRSPHTKERLPLHRCHALVCLSLHRASAAPTSDICRIIYQIPSSLTILDLSFIPIDTCIKAMLRCPNLVEAYIHSHQVEDDYSTPDYLRENWFIEPVAFPHLKVFLWDWSHDGSDWAEVFFERLQTPSLCTLVLAASYDGQLQGLSSGERRFIDQLPRTLRTLKLQQVADIDVDSLGHLLNYKSSLENLIVSYCEVEVMASIFNILHPPKDTTDQPICLPLLKSLLIVSCAVDEDECVTLELQVAELGPLVEALEHRLGTDATFKLEFSRVGIDWSPKLQRKLQSLVAKGVRLELIEDSEPVNWLQVR